MGRRGKEGEGGGRRGKEGEGGENISNLPGVDDWPDSVSLGQY